MTFRRSGAFIAAVLMVVSVAGPVFAGGVWTMGFKGGVATSDFHGSDVTENLGNRVGFAGGLYGQVDVSDRFGIRMEGLYHMKGVAEDSANASASVKLDYIEFPILLMGQIPASDGATLSVFAGPVLAFNTSAKLEGTVDGFTASVDIKDYIASFEFGLAFGLGASFEAGSARITLDGRYQLGLTNVEDTGGAAPNSDVKNQGWVFMAGGGFPVGSN